MRVYKGLKEEHAWRWTDRRAWYCWPCCGTHAAPRRTGRLSVLKIIQNTKTCVKVAIRIHNLNTDRLLWDWVLLRRPVSVFSALGSGPGVYSQQHDEEDCHPHYTTEYASAMAWGELINLVRSLPRLTFLLASKNHRCWWWYALFHFQQRKHITVPLRVLSTELNWLRPVTKL